MKHLHNYSNQLKTHKHCISLPFILKIMNIEAESKVIYFIFKLQIIFFVEFYGL